MEFESITLERGPCYGTCPVYSVTIRRDGFVEWTGERFVKEKGSRSWVITQTKIDALEKFLEKAKFMDLRDKYTKHDATDDASARITVEFKDGTIKKVDHYFGDFSAPEVLAWLEKKIDGIAGTQPYIRSEH